MTTTPADQPTAVVLLSGGLDSATCLAIARDRGLACHTIAFDYGQRHRHELHAAETIARTLGAHSHRVVNINLRQFGGSALTADIPVPKDRPLQEHAEHDIPVTYVPARNLVFLSLSLALAEPLAARHIFIGVNAVDYSGYPDCRAEFIEQFERTANLATKAGAADNTPFSIVTPLIDLTKAQIIQAGAALGIDYALTHSCYDPEQRGDTALACGRCDSCRLRAQGFKDAGVPDPTRYA